MLDGHRLTYRRLVSLMATHGSIYPLTVDKTESSIRLYDLIRDGVKIQGALVATRQSTKDLMQFAARHNVRPTIVKFPLTKAGIEMAIERLEKGQIRYRAVLVNGM